MTTPNLDQVLDENHERLVRLARRYAGPNDWQDLLQEIAVNLWRGLPGFDGRAKLSTWVFRVAVNTALQHLRRRKPETTGLTAEDLGSEAPGDPLVILEAFLRALNPVNRALLLLDLEGLHRDEIAAVLGLSPGAVAVRMTRLKQRFEEQFLEVA